MVPASRPFLAYIILPAWPGPLSLLSQGGGGGGAHTSAPHWILAWAGPNTVRGWQLRSRHILCMVKTKVLHSAYCPTGGCTRHPPFCLSLSPVRLLHSYVCPSTCILHLSYICKSNFGSSPKSLFVVTLLSLQYIPSVDMSLV